MALSITLPETLNASYNDELNNFIGFTGLWQGTRYHEPCQNCMYPKPQLQPPCMLYLF